MCNLLISHAPLVPPHRRILPSFPVLIKLSALSSRCEATSARRLASLTSLIASDVMTPLSLSFPICRTADHVGPRLVNIITVFDWLDWFRCSGSCFLSTRSKSMLALVRNRKLSRRRANNAGGVGIASLIDGDRIQSWSALKRKNEKVVREKNTERSGRTFC